MNEPVLNTLRPLEEIEHESEEEDENNFDESAEGKQFCSTYPAMFCQFSWSAHFYFVFVGLPTTNTPSPAAKRKTNYLTGKPSITKTISMESGSNMDPNEIKLAGNVF